MRLKTSAVTVSYHAATGKMSLPICPYHVNLGKLQNIYSHAQKLEEGLPL